MKISAILNHIGGGLMALPEFQYGCVWNRHQVRRLFDLLHHRHPVGSPLVWVTVAKTAVDPGDRPLAASIVTLLWDGLRRVTSLYGTACGIVPAKFGGAQHPMGAL
jgi:hypothetical protein